MAFSQPPCWWGWVTGSEPDLWGFFVWFFFLRMWLTDIVHLCFATGCYNFQISSLLSCLLCVDTSLVHPFFMLEWLTVSVKWLNKQKKVSHREWTENKWKSRQKHFFSKTLRKHGELLHETTLRNHNWLNVTATSLKYLVQKHDDVIHVLVTLTLNCTYWVCFLAFFFILDDSNVQNNPFLKI